MNIWKSTVLIVCVLLTLQAKAQERVVRYISKHGKQVEKGSAALFQVIEVDAERNAVISQYTLDSIKVLSTRYIKYDPKLISNTLHGPYQKWYTSGQLKEEGNYNNHQMEGKQTQWYENGQLHFERKFKEGLMEDTLKVYYDNGSLRRQDIYKKNKIVSGTVYAKDGTVIKPYFPFEVYPQYPGGEKALFTFIGREIKYPKAARKEKAEGTVLISFTIEKDGSMSEPEIIRSVHPVLDAEAERIVSLLGNWTPKKVDGEPEAMRFNLPLKFSLK